MNRVLKLHIQCGDTTCASSRGDFCPYLLVQRFGSERVCQLFSPPRGRSPGGREPLDVVDGWVQRHVDCIHAEDI